MANYELVALNEAGPDLRVPTASDTGTIAGNLSVTGTAATGALTVTGTASATTGMAVGGATAGAGGIAFPATAVAVADANTLDDYEEGTWTPSLTFATAGDLSVTYGSERFGTYRKIGNLVIASFAVATTSAFTHTTASGNFQITGLPFASAANGSDYSGGVVSGSQGWTKANYTALGAVVVPANSYAIIAAYGSGQGADNLAAGDIPTGTVKTFRGTLIYRV